MNEVEYSSLDLSLNSYRFFIMTERGEGIYMQLCFVSAQLGRYLNYRCRKVICAEGAVCA